MKNNYNKYTRRALALSLVLIIFMGCSKDFLEQPPLGQAVSENYFDTDLGATNATNAIYSKMRDWDMHTMAYISLGEIASDDADKGSADWDGQAQGEIDNFTYNSTNIIIRDWWIGHYQAINRANQVITRVPSAEGVTPELGKRLVAEAKFLRGYFYFNLVRAFGGVPLVTINQMPEDANIPRSTVDEVYALIISDLTSASEVLPDSYPNNEIGRATKGAALGMLAKVYLFRNDYVNAEKYARQVEGMYSLDNDFSNIFRISGENGSGSLFEVQAEALKTGGGGTQYSEVQGIRGPLNKGWGFNSPSINLMFEYEKGDPRIESTIITVSQKTDGNIAIPDTIIGTRYGSIQENKDSIIVPVKMILYDGTEVTADVIEREGPPRYNYKSYIAGDPILGNGNGPTNIRILRYADVLLILAESANENGNTADALKYLEMVRARARAGNSSILPEVTTTDKDELRKAIWHERRVELAMEQHRFFDIVRQGRAEELMHKVGKTNFVAGKNEIYPIPQIDIDLSNGVLVQNPGY
jgi:hypothetical protein